MSTLRDLVEEHTSFSAEDVEHLHRLAGDWQLLADLSFADLLLWVPVADGGFLCCAQVRPTTAPTIYLDDMVGRLAEPDLIPYLRAAATGGQRPGAETVPDGSDPALDSTTETRIHRREAITVRRGERIIGVVARVTNLPADRVHSTLEEAYFAAAHDLGQMIAAGTFPTPPVLGETSSAPRVGDGLIRLDRAGIVTFASPNAQSAYRRLGLAGDLLGEHLAVLTHGLATDPLEGGEIRARIHGALRGEASARSDVEARGATVVVRALPLMPAGETIGALVLVRDVTDVRRRDKALITKDATIREIHHRVKNNLQTVAALLRLQARRVGSADARAALEESVRRVASIAMVHETLAASMDETVDFDAIVDKVVSMVAEVAAPESKVAVRREGAFGVLAAQIATPLVTVVTELAQNAVEHAYGPGEAGEVVVGAHRWRGRLHVRITDDGRGLPSGFDLDSSERLGLQIVRTLVTGELNGTLEIRPRADTGTEAVLIVPLLNAR